MSELVSIIIPTYNRAHLIGDTLDSILNQTYSNWECIIVDDGSEDETKSLLQNYISRDTRFKYFARPGNLKVGTSSCRNYGFNKSKGTLINWFDDDDIMLPEFLEAKITQFKPGVDSVVCKLKHYDFQKNVALAETRINSNNLIEDYLLGKVIFFVSGPLWKREFLLKQKELFDEDISNLDDWDFNLRMLYAKPNFIFIDKALILYRVHSESLSFKIKKLNFEEIKSEMKARNKHLRILLLKKNISLKGFKNFTLNRNRVFLREALVLNNEASFFLYKNLMVWYLVSFNFIAMVKVTSGFLSYNLTGKGYWFLK